MESSDRVPAILSFIHAVEQGSFAAAARSLGISAAAVSKNIAGLERSLGVRLMNRTTRSLQLTGEGRTFFETARIAIDALDLAFDRVAAQRVDPVGKVRLSVANAIGRAFMLPLLPELTTRYPLLNFEIDFDDRRVDLVKEGYDLALRGGMAGDSSLISRPISVLRTALVASPAYLRQHGIPKHHSELEQHRLIAVRFLNRNMAYWTFKNAAGEMTDYEPESPVLTVSAFDVAVDAAVRGIGIAQAGIHDAWHHLHEGRLAIILAEEHCDDGRELTLQYPHRNFMPPRIRVTIDFLLEKFAANKALHVSPAELRQFTVS